MAAALYPVFGHLGQRPLWEDEADTALFARAIVETGLPRAWDGRTFVDSDWGRRVAPELFGAPLVMVGTPWLPYYATATSFAVLGESRLAARLPSAAAALATLVLLYELVRRATGDSRAALAAALLLLGSAQFLLYARESRHYALDMLLSLGVLGGFLRLRARPRSPAFAACSVLLFHTQFLPAVAWVGGCASLAHLHPAFRDLRRPFWRWAPWIVAATAPWLLVTWRAVGTHWVPPQGAGDLALRAGQLALESGIAIPWLGLASGVVLVRRRLTAPDRQLLALGAAVLAAVFLITPWLMSSVLLAALGLRYLTGLLPLGAALAGVVVARASDGRRLLLAAGIALFGLTHLPGRALPSLWIGESGRLGHTALVANVPRETRAKLLNLDTWFLLRGLGREDPGTPARLAAWLAEHGRADDVVVTNFSWDALYWSGGQPQALRLPAGAPLEGAARAAGLPDYVFEATDADWVVWRAAEPIPGHPLDRVRRELQAHGRQLRLEATFPETLWENRPELAWHRFPGVGHPYAPRRVGPGGARRAPARIFRVTPARAGVGGADEEVATSAP